MCLGRRGAGSSPSPPRSGGEGRGEVAPSIVPNFFFRRGPRAARVPQTARLRPPTDQSAVLSRRCFRAAGGSANVAASRNVPATGTRPPQAKIRNPQSEIRNRSASLELAVLGFGASSFGPSSGLRHPSGHGMITLAIIRPDATDRAQGGRRSKYDANH